MARSLRAFALIASAALVLVAPAHAVTGSASDAQRDWTSTSGTGETTWDIKQVTHADDRERVTYTVESFGPFELMNLSLKWQIDCRGDGNDELAVWAYANAAKTVYQVEVTISGGGTLARGDATQDGQIVTVTFPRHVLDDVDCGPRGRYKLFTTYRDPDGFVDVVPNTERLIVHTFGADPNGAPDPTTDLSPSGDASASPSPTAQPSTATTPSGQAVSTADTSDGISPAVVGMIALGLVALVLLFMLVRQRRKDAPAA